MTAETDIQRALSPLARGACVRCGRRIVFLHVLLCDDCLTARLEGQRRECG
jgi:NMD protein affecting ribosome stability and mRNA decay